MSAYAQHRLVINVKRRHLTLLVSVQACNSSSTNEKETPMHMYLIRSVKACLRVAPPSAHSGGYIHDTSVWHPLYTCCCCVHINAPLAAARHNPSKLGFCSRLAQTFDCGSLKPHGKRQVNASFLILLPQHLYVSACHPRTLIFI